MQPQFFAINGLVLAMAQIVSIDFSRPGQAMVQLTSGNVHTFEGEAAEKLGRCFFFRVAEPLMSEPADESFLKDTPEPPADIGKPIPPVDEQPNSPVKDEPAQ